MKTSHKLFFAIPFDSATKNLYDRVCCTISKQYPSVTTVIGNREVGPSPIYSDIALFKAQNRELTDQFAFQIRKADIIVADLTHNNPNVHFELGIALMMNKNILRVTGRSVTELGFDIRNLEVHQYRNETQLTEIITGYLDTFFKIKQLPIAKEYAPLYWEESIPMQLRAKQSGFIFQPIGPPNFVMRDGAVQVGFEILDARSPEDWFGVYIRAGEASPLMGSYLVYMRQNGMLEIAVYPSIRVLAVVATGQAISGRQMLTIQFENDYLDVQVGHARLRYDKLSHQTVGRVLPAAWYADVDVHSAEMICRDTIEWA